MALDSLPRVTVSTRRELRAWLAANCENSGSIWLVTYKKSSGKPHLPYAEIVEEALCFGWIDSRPAKLDAERSMLLLSPRRKGSAWSKANKDRVERLLAQGLMTPQGLSKVDQAKADKSWNSLDEVDALTIPADLAQAFALNARAAAFFDAFPRSAKRGILAWIGNAKRPETRVRRIAETVQLAAKNLKATFPKDRAAGPVGKRPRT